MAKWILLAALFLNASAFARGKDTDTSASSAIPRFTVKANGGFLLDSGDAEVRRRWSHDVWYSYLANAGFYYNLPVLWEGLYLFGGPELSYYVSEEEHSSGQASSYLTSRFFQLLATVGAGFQPPNLLWGKLGFTLSVSVQAWGQKQTDFDSHGFNKDLGTENTDNLFVYGFTTYYAVTNQWRPFLGYELRNGSIITAGVNYAF